jgi:hypothetical protein
LIPRLVLISVFPPFTFGALGVIGVTGTMIMPSALGIGVSNAILTFPTDVEVTVPPLIVPFNLTVAGIGAVIFTIISKGVSVTVAPVPVVEMIKLPKFTPASISLDETLRLSFVPTYLIVADPSKGIGG